MSFSAEKLARLYNFENGENSDADAVDAELNQIVLQINNLIDDQEVTLAGTADGDSGADKVGVTTISPFVATTIQAFLEELVTRLKSITDSASGADLIGATTITDLTGATVQAILEDIRNTLRSTTDSDSGADFVKNTVISPFASTTLQTLLEEIVTRLQATTDSASGADLIAVTTITDLVGNTVQAVLEDLRNTLRSTTDSDSGADFVKVTTISGLVGASVQEVLEDLASTLQSTTDSDSGADFVKNTAISPFSSTTLQSLIEEIVTRLQATTDSSSGADLIGATTVSGITGNTVQAILEALKVYIDSQSPLTIPNDSITNAKLDTDIKVGSLASLTTTEKASVVGAINEVDTNTDANTTNLATAEVKRKLQIETVEDTKAYPVTDDSDNIVRVEHIDDATSVSKVNAIQLVTNGDFVDGASWVPTYATESITGNIYTLEGLGTNATVLTDHANTALDSVGDKFYTYARIRVTNSSAVAIASQLAGGVSDAVDSILTPTQNTWYELSGVTTRSAGASSSNLRIYHVYADASTANGKVMEIDGSAGFGVKCINLTEVFGAGNEPDKTWCDAVFGVAGYWEGVKSFWNTYNVTSLRTDVIEYFSATNLVTDGNMTDASNWTDTASSGTVSNNTYANTADGTQTYGYLSQAISDLDNVNSIFYAGMKGRVTNSLAASIDVRAINSTQAVKLVSSPTQNVWYDLTGIITRGAVATSSIACLHLYDSTGDATGAVAEVQQARVLNLTANNMTDFTADQLDKLGYGEEYEIIKETRTDSDSNVLTEITYIADNVIVNEEVEVA